MKARSPNPLPSSPDGRTLLKSDIQGTALCSRLWARESAAADLEAYEDRVMALIPEQGTGTGSLLQALRAGRPSCGADSPCPAQLSLDSQRANSRRLALAAERDRDVALTGIFPTSSVPGRSGIAELGVAAGS